MYATNHKIIGASFCHRHLINQKSLITDALNAYASLGLKNIRLGCYWSEIEKTAGQYDFEVIDKLVNKCRKLGIQIVMTVGMKAPRYPEYYIPDWVIDKTDINRLSFTYQNDFFSKILFSFVKQVIAHFKDNDSIVFWQIENEPLDPSGPRWWRIDYGFLEKETELVRRTDPSRPIVINLWGNKLQKRNYYPQVMQLADIVGFDLYPKVPCENKHGKVSFQGIDDSDSTIKAIIKQIKAANKKVWISELQAEPWIYPESCLPQDVIKNSEWVEDWDIDGIFYWGYEYWYKQKKLGNTAYWEAAQRAIKLYI